MPYGIFWGNLVSGPAAGYVPPPLSLQPEFSIAGYAAFAYASEGAQHAIRYPEVIVPNQVDQPPRYSLREPYDFAFAPLPQRSAAVAALIPAPAPPSSIASDRHRWLSPDIETRGKGPLRGRVQ